MTIQGKSLDTKFPVPASLRAIAGAEARRRSKRDRLSGVLLAAAFLLAAPVTAGDHAWTLQGLDSRGVGSLVFAAGGGLEVYACAGYDGNLSGIWLSAEAGETWSPAASNGLPWPVVYSLAADQARPGTLYAVDGEGYLPGQPPTPAWLYKSTDGAATWSPLNRRGARSVVVSEASASRVYAGVDHEVLSSADGGASWTDGFLYSSGGPLDTLAIISLAVGRGDSSTVYAGADMDYPHESVYRSTDGGATWSARDGGLSLQQSVFALVMDPTDSARVLAGTSAGIWLTTDGGASWSLKYPISTRALAVDPKDAGVVYAGTDGAGVQISRDGGGHWAAFNAGDLNPRVLSLAIDRTGRHLLAGTRSGVFGYDLSQPSVSAEQPLDLSVTPTGETGFLAVTVDGRIVLGTVDSSGQTTLERFYGPYPGWIPRAFASSLDGLTRVLWENTDGRSDVWLADPDGVLGSFVYPAEAGSSVVDVAGGRSGQTHILSKSSQETFLRTIDGEGNLVAKVALGSYPGWAATAISDGADGMTRLLWNNDDGRFGVSVVSSSGIVTTARFASEAGWTTVDIAVGGDGLTRLLRTQGDAGVALLVIDDAGTVNAQGPVYALPAGFRAGHVSAGQDGSSRVLFSSETQGSVAWFLSPDGIFQGSLAINPAAGEPGMAGRWTGTWNHTASPRCDPSIINSGIPAQATFEPVGSAFHGTLSTADVNCDLGFLTFQGTLLGNSLTGTFQDDEGLKLPAFGTLSGPSLEIAIDNGGGYILAGCISIAEAELSRASD